MWRTYNGTILSENLLLEVEKIIQEELKKGYQLKLCIGTDSQLHGETIEFATVVVILRKGHGGKMLVRKSHQKKGMSLKERLLLEVTHSIDVAYSLIELMNRYNIDLEVHADINTDPQFKSERTLSEAKGYILGMGFVFKGKPDSFASTSCADKFVS